MSIPLSKPLVVPEYQNAVVQTYIADPATAATVSRPPYKVDFQSVVSSLFPGKLARPNACALNGNDLFIAQSEDNSQAIFKLPNYLTQPEKAIAQAFVFTLDGSDYVGMAFDAAGNLYAAEGSFGNNHIFKYTGTGKAYPGTAAAAAMDNYATRVDLGNAGATSYFANLAFDGAGNLWVSDYQNHRLVVFDAGNLGGTNTFHVLAGLVALIPVANTNASLNANTSHLFAEPEGIDFDGAGSLWVANNNDGNGGLQNVRTSLVQITPALQAAVLATASGGTLTPAVGQSNTDFFIYQVPNLNDDGGVRPQFGGLQVDRAVGRIFVNEEIAGHGRVYDIATIAAIGTLTATNHLNIVSTNPGNGGLALVNTKVPVLYIRDDAADTGKEPNAIAIAYESPDVWPRQGATGTDTGAGSLGESILGKSQAHVYARITNKGLSPSDGSEEVRLYWAKASAGLSIPTPWNGAVPADGQPFATPQPVPVIAPGQHDLVHFVWPLTPNPQDYPDKDGHFCLLAHITTAASPDFEGFQGTNVHQNVTNLSKVAWRNMHIVGVAPMIVGGGDPIPLGALVAANYTRRAMVAQIAFEILDASARLITSPTGRLLITPNEEALEKLRGVRTDRPFLESLGHGVFRLLDIAAGIPSFKLKPREKVHFGLSYVPDREARGFAVRAIQYAVDGAIRETIGGQTFIAGHVEGLTARPGRPAPETDDYKPTLLKPPTRA